MCHLAGFLVMAVLVAAMSQTVEGVVSASAGASAGLPVGWSATRAEHPTRSVVHDDAGRWVATFTDAARTVTLAGPRRTFTERTTSDPVDTHVWVRLLPAPFAGQVDAAWLVEALRATTPDVLALSMEYVEGAPARFDPVGVQIAGDAAYGPLRPDGTREEGADFNDYLGLDWSYGEVIDRAETRQRASLDCSGYMRMLWGYRAGFPLTLRPDGAALPRRAHQMLDSASGVVMNADGVRTWAELLAPGDLVFFDASADDGSMIDHVGMYLGLDAGGAQRFISSRKSPDGPTMGDHRGRSALDGEGLYARSFRAARRL